MDISVVLPCYNTSGTLEELSKRLIKVLEAEAKTFEIIMVNDCSPEEDWAIITKLGQSDSRIKGIDLSRNFGQYEAITAGLDHVCGDNIVLMDADLQDIPEELPKLIKGIEQGYDIAYGARVERKDTFFKKLSSKSFHAIFSYLSGAKTDKEIATYMIFSRKVANVLISMRERYREIYLLSNWIGFKTIKIEIKHDKRGVGQTGYTFKKSVDLALGAMFAYSEKPLKFAVVAGFIFSSFSLLYGTYIFCRALLGLENVEGWSSLMFSIWFMGGILLSFMGITGIYIGKIFEEVKQRPLYIIKDQLNM